MFHNSIGGGYHYLSLMAFNDETGKTTTQSAPFSFSAGQKVYLFFKRIIDLGGSFVGIILLGLPMLVIAIITQCTSKGPALYKQTRLGKDEKPFTMLKFRSMRADAPAIAPADMAPGEQEHLITKWGCFIRKTSIDEWPQLFNIFVGHMSFIGPRPQQEKEHELKLYNARHEFSPTAFAVKPGLCSLAIVKMHRSHDPKEKAFYDSEYARKVSLKMDVVLFFAAVGILLGIRKQDKGK